MEGLYPAETPSPEAAPYPVETRFPAEVPCLVEGLYPAETPSPEGGSYRVETRFPVEVPCLAEGLYPVETPSPEGAPFRVETRFPAEVPCLAEGLSPVETPSPEGVPCRAGMTFPIGATFRKVTWTSVAARSAGSASCRTSASSRSRLGRCYSARGVRRRMPVSRSCSAETSPGASVNGSCADWVFGKAITSRMLSAPVISMTMRSRP